MFQLKPAVYDSIRRTIRNGDIALARSGSIEGEIIEALSGSTYTHATMLGWAGDGNHRTLMIGDARQHTRTGLIDARSEFLRWPGYYDVLRPYTQHDRRGRYVHYQRDAAWAFICHAGGVEYGLRHALRLGRRLLGMGGNSFANSDDPQKPRFCSELVHAALRAGGGPQVKPCDADVAPGDLCDPTRFRYLFTVFATEDQTRCFSKEMRDASERVA